MDFCKRNKSVDLQKPLWMLLLNFNFLGRFVEVILKKSMQGIKSMYIK